MRSSCLSMGVKASVAAGLLMGVCGLVSCAGKSEKPADQRSGVIKPLGEPGKYAVVNGKAAPVPSIPMGDPATVERIIDEAKNRSQVKQHITTISETFGARLTGSTASEKAELWARDQFRSWGWNAELVQWGEIATRYDRGAQWARVLVKSGSGTRPQQRGDDRDGSRSASDPVIKKDPPEGYRVLRDMQFTTLAWTSGTEGPRRGPVLRMPKSDAEYQAMKDKLKGAWILVPRIPLGENPGVDMRRGGGVRGRFEQRLDARKKVAEGKTPEELGVEQRILFSGIHGFISASVDDRVWTSSASNWRTREAKDFPPDIEVNVRLSDYDYISSRLTDGDPIEVEADLPVTITPGPIPVYNVVAELKGTEKPDEVVLLSAHFDSWNGPGSQGTVDNGTGSAVMMEAARLLSVAGARPKRTIRVVLWTGEEQGLLGARAYVKANEASWDKFSAVFNDDGGTNSQGGLSVIQEMVPYLSVATAPINGRFFSAVDGKYLDVNLRVQERFTQNAGSDHYAFVEVGIPGFFWDEVGRADYFYAWHTQHDRIDQAIEEYLVQSAACSAVTAYNIASAPGLLPRWNRAEGTVTAPTSVEGRGPGQQPGVQPRRE